jgi:phosphatidylglycerophosphate synthase
VALDLTLALLATLAIASALVRTLPLSLAALGVVGAVYAATAWGILRGLRAEGVTSVGRAIGTEFAPELRHWPGLGPANRITLARVVLSLPLVTIAVWPQAVGIEARIWTVALGTVALALDGVDGWLARRTGCDSPFGARFDMESDAALLMVLSVLAWRSGQVGAWVLAIGGMRYVFVAAGWRWSWLQGELPPSMARKVVCVIQGIALLAALAPFTSGGVAVVVSAGAVAALGGSFGRDALWLYRHREQGPRSLRPRTETCRAPRRAATPRDPAA